MSPRPSDQDVKRVARRFARGWTAKATQRGPLIALAALALLLVPLVLDAGPPKTPKRPSSSGGAGALEQPAGAGAGAAAAGAASDVAGAAGAVGAIKDVRFVDGKSAARVEILVEGKIRHRLTRDEGQPVLVLEGARIPRLLERKLDTSELRGPVESVSSFRRPGGGPDAVVVKVELREPRSSYRLRRLGSAFVWEFPKKASASASARPAEAGPSAGEDGESGEAMAYNYAPTQVAPAGGQRGRRRYSGRRIDLDFKDADIHNLLRLFADVGNVNIVTSDAVAGKVTVRMKNVPWDQALDVVLRAKGLGQVREANLIRVAPLVDLEKEREAEIARQAQVQALRPLETRLIPLSYARADKVLDKLQYTLSPRGKLSFDERTNMVIARDTGPNLDLVERMLRALDTQTPQVLIEARIVEARTNYAKELGIQWGGGYSASTATGNPTGLVFPYQIGIGGGVQDRLSPTGGLLLGQASNPNFAVDLPATVASGSGGALGLTLGSVGGAVNINLRLSAAEANGDIRIVSAPKVMTLDNVEARIQQGVTIPYSQVSAAGVQTTFKDADLNMTVRPHVTADGSIVMTVQITRNEPDFVNTGPRGEPTILKKEVKTEMLVKDGDTGVIGGIYTTRVGELRRRVPYLANIPILGYLFRYHKDSTDREEVLVFITPRIVNRAQALAQ